MNKIVLSGAVAAVVIAAADHIQSLQHRLDVLSQVPRVPPAAVDSLQHELTALRLELETTRTALEQDDSRQRLEERLARVAHSIEANDCVLVDHAARLANWEERWQGRDPVEIDRDLATVRDGLAQRGLDITRVSTKTEELAAQERARIDSLDRRIEPLLAGRDMGRLQLG